MGYMVKLKVIHFETSNQLLDCPTRNHNLKKPHFWVFLELIFHKSPTISKSVNHSKIHHHFESYYVYTTFLIMVFNSVDLLY